MSGVRRPASLPGDAGSGTRDADRQPKLRPQDFLNLFLAETFKEDVCGGVVPLTAYPTTLRRTVIDIAAKFVRHAGKIVLKVSAAVLEALDFQTLWTRSGSPPKLSLT